MQVLYWFDIGVELYCLLFVLRNTNSSGPPRSKSHNTYFCHKLYLIAMPTSEAMPSPSCASTSTSAPRSTSSNPLSLFLSTAFTDSPSCSFSESHINQPPHLSGQPPTFAPKPDILLPPDKSIYSFAWASSDLDSLNPDKPESAHSFCESFDEMTRPSKGNQPVPTEKNALPSSRVRHLAPSLPSPIFWSTVSVPDTFEEYIRANTLLLRDRHILPPPNSRSHASEGMSKNISNLAAILRANTDLTKISRNCPTNWIADHFSDKNLPVPFQESLLIEDPHIWKKSTTSDSDSTFFKLPNTSSDARTASWLGHIALTLGSHHGIHNQAVELGNRVFNSEGANAPLAGQLHERKPDIVLIDNKYRDHVPLGVRLNWSVVQAIIEVTSQENRSFNEHMRSMLSKAANILHAQIHRRYVIGIVISGKREEDSLSFFCVFIDRVGASTTMPLPIKGYGALSFGRLIFGLTYGNDALLGFDISITINRFTGDPVSVIVDGLVFTFVSEIFNSPFLFGRGTRVFIVKDESGSHHVLKDSWILATHNVSEVDNLKKISAAAQSDDVDARLRALSPKFIAGDDNVDQTFTNRRMLPTKHTQRQRRRIVTGPIGDPITSYCSRVECLQAFIDIADRKCSIVFCVH